MPDFENLDAYTSQDKRSQQPRVIPIAPNSLKPEDYEPHKTPHRERVKKRKLVKDVDIEPIDVVQMEREYRQAARRQDPFYIGALRKLFKALLKALRIKKGKPKNKKRKNFQNRKGSKNNRGPKDRKQFNDNKGQKGNKGNRNPRRRRKGPKNNQNSNQGGSQNNQPQGNQQAASTSSDNNQKQKPKRRRNRRNRNRGNSNSQNQNPQAKS